MNKVERIKLIKAMEYVCRQMNDEIILLDLWLLDGVADGDIDYADLSIKVDDEENLSYYTEDEHFGELMGLFLECMRHARRSGGLYCDGVVSTKQ